MLLASSSEDGEVSTAFASSDPSLDSWQIEVDLVPSFFVDVEVVVVVVMDPLVVTEASMIYRWTQQEQGDLLCRLVGAQYQPPSLSWQRSVGDGS